HARLARLAAGCDRLRDADLRTMHAVQAEALGDRQRDAAPLEVVPNEPAPCCRLALVPNAERVDYPPPSLRIIALSIVPPARQFVGRFIGIGKSEPFEFDHDCGATTACVTMYDEAGGAIGECQGCAATAM